QPVHHRHWRLHPFIRVPLAHRVLQQL
ncbi:hypothetical protein HaLaN_26630, partial [Haematococcus lacustris]